MYFGNVWGKGCARIWHFSCPLSSCVLLKARLRGLGRYVEVGPWFGQMLEYSGDNWTCGCNAGGGGAFAFVQSSALRLQIFWVTLANHFPPDSILDLKNWDYDTDWHYKMLSHLRMENFKSWDLVYFCCSASHQIGWFISFSLGMLSVVRESFRPCLCVKNSLI